MFLAEFSSSLDSEAISSLYDLAAISRVLAVIKHGEIHTFSGVPPPSEIHVTLPACALISRTGEGAPEGRGHICPAAASQARGHVCRRRRRRRRREVGDAERIGTFEPGKRNTCLFIPQGRL